MYKCAESLQVITMGLANVSESSTVVDPNALLAGLANAAKEMEPGKIPPVTLLTAKYKKKNFPPQIMMTSHFPDFLCWTWC